MRFFSHACSGLLLSTVLLSGCGLEAELDQELMDQDRTSCAAQGFAVGTTAMATCMNTRNNNRIAEDRASDERIRAEEERRQRNRQTTDISRVPPSTRPTIERIPGADGESANMVMCSDGALREDCADAPNGF